MPQSQSQSEYLPCEGSYKKSCSSSPEFAIPNSSSRYFTCSGGRCRYCREEPYQYRIDKSGICTCPQVFGASICNLGGNLIIEDHCMDENQDGLHNIEDMLSCMENGSTCGHPIESCGLFYSANPHVNLDENNYPDNCSKLLFEHAVGSLDNLPPNRGANLENPPGSVIQRILSYAAKKDPNGEIGDLNDISSPPPFYKTDGSQYTPWDSSYFGDLKDICLKFETVYNNGTCLTGPDNNHLPFFTKIHEDCSNYLDLILEDEELQGPQANVNSDGFTLNTSELSNWLNTFNYRCHISSPGSFNTMTNNEFSDLINNDYFNVNYIDGVNMIMDDNGQPIRPLSDPGTCPDNTNYNIVCTNPNDMTFGAEVAVSNPCDYDQIDLQQQLSNLHAEMISLSQQNTDNSQQDSLLYTNLQDEIDTVNNNLLVIEQSQDTYRGDFQQASAQFRSINDQMTTLTGRIQGDETAEGDTNNRLDVISQVATNAEDSASNALTIAGDASTDASNALTIAGDASADASAAATSAAEELELAQQAQRNAEAAQRSAEESRNSLEQEMELLREQVTDPCLSNPCRKNELCKKRDPVDGVIPTPPYTCSLFECSTETDYGEQKCNENPICKWDTDDSGYGQCIDKCEYKNSEECDQYYLYCEWEDNTCKDKEPLNIYLFFSVIALCAFLGGLILWKIIDMIDISAFGSHTIENPLWDGVIPQNPGQGLSGSAPAAGGSAEAIGGPE